MNEAYNATREGTHCFPWLAPLLQLPFVEPEAYTTQAPVTHRQRLGQFFTPRHIAEWMAAWCVQPETRSVLDPAVGTGALLRAVATHPLAVNVSMTGMDIDPAVLQVCQHNFRDHTSTLTLRRANFLAEPLDRQYDAIVCNPPYVRHRALAHRERLYVELGQRFGLKLNRFSNSYVLFMLQIAGLLSRRGRAAIITPVDYLNANFGTPIKAFLLRENLLDGLLLFERSTLVFDEANVAACILLLRTDRKQDEPVSFIRVPNDKYLLPREDMPTAWQAHCFAHELRPDVKWRSLFPYDVPAPRLVRQRRSIQLGKLADVRRGIATGANDFFTLNEVEREQHGIELHACRPCVTKAIHAGHLRFSRSDFDRLRHNGKKVYLLDVGRQLSPAVERYLAEGIRRELHQRFLTRQRRLWYAAEQKPSAPLWVQTFSRQGFRFVLNDAGVANLTTFHAIYPHSTDPEYILLLAALLNTSCVAATLASHARLYGSGLQKLEPRDVAVLELPHPDFISDAHRTEIISLYQRRCAFEQSNRDEAELAAREIERIMAG